MNLSDPISRMVLPLARWGAILCGWWLLIFSILTCVEILGRRFFGFSLQGIDEIGGYTLAVMSSFGFSYALVNRSHTRVDIFMTMAPRPVQAIFNLLAMVSLAGVAVFAASRGWSEFSQSVVLKSVSSSPLQTPLWLPQGLWFLGLAIFAGIAVALSVHALYLFGHHKVDVNRLYGPSTVEEEVEAELRTLQAAKKIPS